jgi:hypothetical protein
VASLPFSVARVPGAAVSAAGAKAQMPSSWHTVPLPLIVFPMASALTAPPVTKLIGNVPEMLEVSPFGVSTPVSGAVLPGLFNSVTMVPSGCCSLIVRSPTHVCVSLTLLTVTPVSVPESATTAFFDAMETNDPL